MKKNLKKPINPQPMRQRIDRFLSQCVIGAIRIGTSHRKTSLSEHDIILLEQSVPHVVSLCVSILVIGAIESLRTSIQRIRWWR